MRTCLRFRAGLRLPHFDSSARGHLLDIDRWIVTLPPAALPPFSPGDYSAWFKDAVAPTPHPVTFAFLGAYFYSLQMVIKRFMRRDLGANAYNAISLRIVLAVIGIWVALLCFRVLDSGVD